MQRKQPPIAEPAVAGYTIPYDRSRWFDRPSPPLTDPPNIDRTCLSANDLRSSSDESTRTTGIQQFLESNQPKPAYLPAHDRNRRHINSSREPHQPPCPYRPSHERQPIIAFTRPDHCRSRHSTVQPTLPGQPPSQVSGSYLPGSGTPWAQEERSSIDSSRDADKAHACSEHLPL